MTQMSIDYSREIYELLADINSKIDSAYSNSLTDFVSYSLNDFEDRLDAIKCAIDDMQSTIGDVGEKQDLLQSQMDEIGLPEEALYAATEKYSDISDDIEDKY